MVNVSISTCSCMRRNAQPSNCLRHQPASCPDPARSYSSGLQCGAHVPQSPAKDPRYNAPVHPCEMINCPGLQPSCNMQPTFRCAHPEGWLADPVTTRLPHSSFHPPYSQNVQQCMAMSEGPDVGHYHNRRVHMLWAALNTCSANPTAPADAACSRCIVLGMEWNITHTLSVRGVQVLPQQ
jgi:hypothetical protein